MVERLARLRGPAVLALIIVCKLRIVLGVVDLTVAVRSSPADGQRAAAALDAAAVAVDPLTVLLLAALLVSCVLWSPIRHARTFTTWALVVVSAGVLLSLAAAVGWLWLPPVGASTLLEAVQLLLRLVIPALVLVGLARLRRKQTPAAAELEGAPQAAIEASSPPMTEPDPAREPTWQPDEAAGAAWMTAGDAASGAAASGWGSAAGATGWSPRPNEPPSEPPAPRPDVGRSG